MLRNYEKPATPRQKEQKKTNFKIAFCVLSSNFFLLMIFIFLDTESIPAPIKKFTLPSDYKTIVINASAFVTEENIPIQITNEQGKIVIEKAIFLQAVSTGHTPRYKIALSNKSIKKLPKHNRQELYIYPYTSPSNTKNYQQEKNYELIF